MVSLATAQRLAGLGNQLMAYRLDLDDPATMEQTQRELAASLGPEFEVRRWDDIVPFMRENFRVEDVGASIGLFIFFVVAALGSANAIMMSIMERTREIGTMAALGVRARTLLKLFLLEGTLIGFAAALIGVSAGYLTVNCLHRVGILISSSNNSVPLVVRPEVSFTFLATAWVFGWLGTTVAALWPAWRATRLSPVVALQC